MLSPFTFRPAMVDTGLLTHVAGNTVFGDIGCYQSGRAHCSAQESYQEKVFSYQGEVLPPQDRASMVIGCRTNVTHVGGYTSAGPTPIKSRKEVVQRKQCR
jgi:hypothetical protein